MKTTVERNVANNNGEATPAGTWAESGSRPTPEVHMKVFRGKLL